MASSDVCSVVAGPLEPRAGASDVHAVWQAWAVSLILWSSRNRDCVCACEPYTERTPLTHRGGQERTQHPSRRPLRSSGVALTHRPWASVAFLPRCSQVVSNRKASVFNGDTRSRHRLQDVKKKQQQKNNPTSVLHVTRTLLPMEQAHVYTQPIASVWYRLLFISI